MCPRKSLSMMFAALAAATLTAAVELRSPGGTLTLRVWEEAGKALYAIDAGGQSRVLPSTLGLRTEGAGDFTHGLTMGTPEKGERTETWRPVVGEQETQSIALRTLRVPFHSAEGTLTLEACVAEEGVALRYLLPQPKQGTSYRLPRTGEATTVALPNGTLAYAHQGHNQTMPRKFAPEHLPEVCRPLTLRFSDGAAMALCEADLRNSAVLRWKGAEKGRPLLKALTSGDNLVDGEGPKSTPWRVFLFAASEGALPEKAPLLEALNAPADEATYHFADWVRPGTCVRLMELNNAAAQSLIDEAARRGIRYILLDTGWYGPEYDPNCDPRLDPTALKPDSVPSDRILLERHLTAGEGCFSTHGKGFAKYGRLGDNGDMHVNLNLPALCAYAKAKGVGVILYVNGVFLPDGRGRFTADELFARFRRWGVAGVKPGFVKHSSQKDEAYLRNLVKPPPAIASSSPSTTNGSPPASPAPSPTSSPPKPSSAMRPKAPSPPPGTSPPSSRGCSKAPPTTPSVGPAKPPKAMPSPPPCSSAPASTCSSGTPTPATSRRTTRPPPNCSLPSPPHGKPHVGSKAAWKATPPLRAKPSPKAERRPPELGSSPPSPPTTAPSAFPSTSLRKTPFIAWNALPMNRMPTPPSASTVPKRPLTVSSSRNAKSPKATCSPIPSKQELASSSASPHFGNAKNERYPSIAMGTSLIA